MDTKFLFKGQKLKVLDKSTFSVCPDVVTFDYINKDTAQIFVDEELIFRPDLNILHRGRPWFVACELEPINCVSVGDRVTVRHHNTDRDSELMVGTVREIDNKGSVIAIDRNDNMICFDRDGFKIIEWEKNKLEADLIIHDEAPMYYSEKSEFNLCSGADAYKFFSQSVTNLLLCKKNLKGEFMELNELSNNSLKEAKKQFNLEKQSEEVRFAKQQLASLTDSKNSLLREIKKLNAELKEVNKRLKVFGK